MRNKDELKKELEELSPFLFEQKTAGEGYRVPKDYFKDLSDEILLQVKQPVPVTEQQPGWLEQTILAIQYLFQPRFALAYACLALLIAATFFLGNDADSIQQQIAATNLLVEVPDDLLDSYVTLNIDEFDENILTEQLSLSEEEPLPNSSLDQTTDDLNDLIDDLSIEDLEDLL